MKHVLGDTQSWSLKRWNFIYLYCDHTQKPSKKRFSRHYKMIPPHWAYDLWRCKGIQMKGSKVQLNLWVKETNPFNTVLEGTQIQSICLNWCIDSIRAEDANFWRCSDARSQRMPREWWACKPLSGRDECFKLFLKELLQAALLQLAHCLHMVLTETARRVRKWRYQLWLAARDDTPNKGQFTVQHGGNWGKRYWTGQTRQMPGSFQIR